MARNYTADWDAINRVALRFGWKFRDGILLAPADRPWYRIKLSRGRFYICLLDGDRLQLGGHGKSLVSWKTGDHEGLARFLSDFCNASANPVATPKPVAIQRDLFGNITSVRSLTPKPQVQQLSLI